MSSTNSKGTRAFRTIVWKYYKAHGRHDLPWRKTTDPYKILVSEVMLQQTQVPRVIEKFESFLKRFPTVRSLSKAPFSDVLKEWSGLGYNRRAKFLLDAAKALAKKKKLMAGDFAGLHGVGPYTASAVRVFAFNEPDVLIETNIRTAYIHHFWQKYREPFSVLVADRDVMTIAAAAAKGQEPRKWHWALMDYGAYLKKSGVRNNHRSAHYTKQSKFEGSPRQIRGKIVRVLAHEQITERQLMKGLSGKEREKWKKALAGLVKDGLIIKEKGKWQIA